jgi:hypothetical protein
MSALRTTLAHIVSVADVFYAAISASAAVRSHHVPDTRDLRILGIDENSPSVAAMAHY